jgi:hypothetical protein
MCNSHGSLCGSFCDGFKFSLHLKNDVMEEALPPYNEFIAVPPPKNVLLEQVDQNWAAEDSQIRVRAREKIEKLELKKNECIAKIVAECDAEIALVREDERKAMEALLVQRRLQIEYLLRPRWFGFLW